jgi:hypothetical protein
MQAHVSYLNMPKNLSRITASIILHDWGDMLQYLIYN